MIYLSFEKYFLPENKKTSIFFLKKHISHRIYEANGWKTWILF